MLDQASQSSSLDNSPALSRRHASSPAEQPDLLLIERARGGSEQATEALVRRYARRLFRVARTVVTDDERAESVVRDVCVAAFCDLSRYEPTGKFAAWLTRLTYQQARGMRQSGWPRHSTAATASSGEPTTQRVLADGIEQLPEVFRTVFVLRVVEGISGIESAAALGVHETTIRTRLYRALRRLDPELVRAIRLQPDFIDLPAGAEQRVVETVLARFPRTVSAGAAATAPPPR